MEKWNQRDPLTVMVSKFNALVDELEGLKKSSNDTNAATQEQINRLTEEFTQNLQQTTQTIMDDLSDISKELSKKLESEPDLAELEDPELNVHDINRPVSIPQQEAINAAKEEVLAIAEEKLTSEEAGSEISGEDSPEVSPQVKAYVEKMIIQALAGRDLKAHYLNNKLILNTPEPGIIGYDISSDLNLGMVKPSEDIRVDSRTGRMSVPKLAELSTRIEEVNTTLTRAYQTLVKGVQAIAKDVGNVQGLQTETKQDLASAINEIHGKISDN